MERPSVSRSSCSGWVLPGMLEALDQGPHGAVERSCHTQLLSPLGNGAVHEIHFGLPLRQHILQHARFVFSGSARAFLYQLPWIAMKRDAQALGDTHAFPDQRVEQISG